MSDALQDESFLKIKKVIQSAVTIVQSAEANLAKAKQLLMNIENIGADIGNLDAMVQKVKSNHPETVPEEDGDGEVHYGLFDGYFMLAENWKKYPIPLNYSSKSKLVPGDRLKLTIANNWQLLYKLISPCERKHSRAVLTKDDQDQNNFVGVTANGESFALNQAAVTFFKGRPWDEIYIITNKEGTGGYAAIEAVIKS